ncbi:MAG: class I SAM-dependent methyltransferase [Gammaproteobacteria bacterium]|nr:class I SAM-dependent methyltransferase [Gammaproteobacteria bacterium]
MSNLWTCPICDKKQEYNIIADIVWETEIPGPDKYNVIKCENCSIDVSDPIPSDDVLNQYYSNYGPTQTDNLKYRAEKLIDLNDPIVDYLVSHHKGNSDIKFLDYGFGAGAFAINLASKGHDITGIDYSAQNIDQLNNYCRENNLNIETHNISEKGWEEINDKKFNCVTLFQVIEHLQDPVETLKKLNALQNTGGSIYIECPNQDGLFFRLKNKIRSFIDRKYMWGSLSPPQHLFGFNKRSLGMALNAAGYKVIEIGDYRVADKTHAPETAYWYPSIWEWLTDKKKRTFYGTSKMLIRLADYPSSKILKSGGGLFALAIKK